MKRRLGRLLHHLAIAAALLLILASGLALVLRFWLLPDIDRYRPALEQALAQATGQPARIGRLDAEWRGLNPELHLADLRLGPSPDDAPLVLPKVDAVLSWTSLLVGEPRLSRLELHQPRLDIHRDTLGMIRVAGVAINTPGPPSPFPDWLLAQHLLVVRDGSVTWRDELLQAPPLTLDQVRLVLHNRFGRHRLGLTARPPANAAGKLDIRADIRGGSTRQPESFKGQLYLRADQASAAAWRAWLPWSQESVLGGQGSVRMWLELGSRRIQSVLGDVDLRQVRLNLGQDMPDMAFDHLSGRLGWRREGTGHALHIQGLRFTSSTGESGQPADARLLLVPDAEGRPVQVKVTASDLRLESLTALSSAMPLPKGAHDLIAQLKPRGYIGNLKVDWRRQGPLAAQASFRDVGVEASGKLPGLTGLTGEARVDGQGGEVRLRARQLGLRYDPVFRQPLSFDHLDVDVTWRPRPQAGHQVRVSGLRLGNADLEASGQAELTLLPGLSPLVDIRARLHRGEGPSVWRYLPHQISEDAYHWLKNSLRAGVAEDASLILRGPLNLFPFDKGGGEFLVDGRIRDAELNYAPGWPSFSQIQGRLRFRGAGMEILADRARVGNNITLAGVKGVVPDLHYSEDETMHIGGKAAGDAGAFLEFISASPVYDYTDRFTEFMRARGPAELELNLSLPLRKVAATKVKGTFRLGGCRLDPGEDLPVLDRLSGELRFTHRDLKAHGVTATLQDQPVTLDLESQPGGRVRVALDGRMTDQGLSRWLPAEALPLLAGSASYRAELNVKQHKAELRVTSDLTGMAVALPSPLGKRKEDSLPLLLVKSGADDGRDVYLLRYGQTLTARGMPAQGEQPARVGVSIGRAEAPMPSEPGLTVQAQVKRFDVEEWRALAPQHKGEAGKLPLREISLTANQILVGDRAIHDATVTAHPLPDGWRMRVASREIQGDAQVRGDSRDLRLDGKFRRLMVPEPVPGRQAMVSADATRQLFSGRIEADSFGYRGKELGSMSLELSEEPAGWRIRQFSLVSGDDRLEVLGLMADHARRTSSLTLKLDTPKLGNLLGRLGHGGLLKGGKTHVEGQLAWTGGLEDFDLAQLSGKVDLKVGDGQFIKADPGVGRLLGIISLQSLPRRITLDFRDVFSEGFAFDEINGPLHLDRGIAYLPRLNMSGPAAKVEMKGRIDLVKETQDLRLNIQPRVEETLAAGALLINPAVGVGALVASKLLKDPIGKAISFDYLVTGAWDDPQVEKLKRPPAQTDGSAVPAP